MLILNLFSLDATSLTSTILVLARFFGILEPMRFPLSWFCFLLRDLE